MASLPWYKRNPDKALAGMMELSLEERGAYNTILDLIYSKGGQLLDDPDFICGWLRCDIRVWRRLRTALIDRKKIYIEGEYIKNETADRVILRSNRSTQVHDKLPPKSPPDLFGNNDLTKKRPQKPTGRTENLESKKESKKESPHKPPKGAVTVSAPEIGMAFEQLWNAYPGITRQGEVSAGAKGSKQQARILFTKIVTKEKNHEELIRSIQHGAGRYAEYLARSGSCSRHLTTWLNGRGWDDEYEIRGLQPGRGFVRPGADSYDLALEDRTRDPDPEDVKRWRRKWDHPVADDENGGNLLAPPAAGQLPESEG